MWIVILKRRDYFQDTAINGRIDMHFKRRVVGCIYCIHMAVSRDQRWVILKPLIKPSRP
jgi:hypothetical protein